MTDRSDEGVGCRPLLEAVAVGWVLFALGCLMLVGSTPDTIAGWSRFLFFWGLPGTTLLQFISPEGFFLAWPLDLGLWVLGGVWAARARDRTGWATRLGLVVGAAAVLALVAL